LTTLDIYLALNVWQVKWAISIGEVFVRRKQLQIAILRKCKNHYPREYLAETGGRLVASATYSSHECLVVVHFAACDELEPSGACLGQVDRGVDLGSESQNFELVGKRPYGIGIVC